MLDKKEVLNETAIETIVYGGLKNCKKAEMSTEEVEILYFLANTDKNIKYPDEAKPFEFKVIESRMPLYTFKFTDERAIFLLVCISKTVGKAIMYLWYLQGWCKENNVKEVDLDILCQNIFPFGFFAEEDITNVWRNQKLKEVVGFSDNLVDCSKAGKSLMF